MNHLERIHESQLLQYKSILLRDRAMVLHDRIRNSMQGSYNLAFLVSKWFHCPMRPECNIVADSECLTCGLWWVRR